MESTRSIAAEQSGAVCRDVRAIAHGRRAAGRADVCGKGFDRRSRTANRLRQSNLARHASAGVRTCGVR